MQESETKTLVELQETLALLLNKKQSQLADLEHEIREIQEAISKLTKIISNTSFTTADMLLNTETFEKLQSPKFETKSDLTRKILSKTNEILASIKYEKNTIFIRINSPEILRITPENYINSFVKSILVKLKQSEAQLKPNLVKIKIEDEEFVDTIELQNVQKIESLDLVEIGIRSLLGI